MNKVRDLELAILKLEKLHLSIDLQVGYFKTTKLSNKEDIIDSLENAQSEISDQIITLEEEVQHVLMGNLSKRGA